MVIKCIEGRRHEKNEIILKCNGFVYRYLPYWAKLPKGLEGKEITSVSCDSRDFVYVLSRNFDYPVMVFDSEGNFLNAIGKGLFYERPHGIFINRKDELYCTDDKAHVVMKMTRDGKLLKMFGTPYEPSESGCNWNAYEEYRQINGIPSEVPVDGTLSLKLRLDSIIRTAGPFNGPTRMIEAPDGDLFCTDGYGNAAVHHFTNDGTLLHTFGYPGSEPGQFRLPHGLIMDKRGRLWIADRENDRIQIFDVRGELELCIKGLLHPTEFCTDGEYIYVSESGGGFTIMNQEADVKAQFGYEKSPFYLHGIGMDSKGNIYGATLSKNRFNNLIKFQRLE